MLHWLMQIIDKSNVKIDVEWLILSFLSQNSIVENTNDILRNLP